MNIIVGENFEFASPSRGQVVSKCLLCGTKTVSISARTGALVICRGNCGTVGHLPDFRQFEEDLAAGRPPETQQRKPTKRKEK